MVCPLFLQWVVDVAESNQKRKRGGMAIFMMEGGVTADRLRCNDGING